ncbi:MAG TPA: tryptophan synthase subunit alpha [Nitrosomonas europaea]|uniref:tryptophan synthase subunit alpha n=1 Tax=Nitrosomonas europaea TaxID=915 RepID=UPI002491938C|nr:tryptophan synthase subunit alpha [Nitrosomonas europaea]HRN81262.1 tryptophan synthase subunit alpha [Nitrosomonas europaea]HRO55485.1 tryptophan synthase subunit alpha [Nitrosomonas europaea]HRQ07491.1 tryptophan synthase subunit alpha [Nitrosomonas europaea]HUM73430.1 tryptophan synthase subunit alpha [Nitrosomonas europaea]
MNRIQSVFSRLKSQNRAALIPFITAGDPDATTTVALMHRLTQAGVDLIELGVPFSDPMADGPTIQRSSERALKHYISLKDVFSMVAEFRKTNQSTPVVLMGYANPIEAMGYKDFVQTAGHAGVDGVLVVDYPPEECTEWVRYLKEQNIDPIFLLSPTTPESRIRRVAELARGYVYYVSLKGVTGASHLDLHEVGDKLSQLRSYINIPIGVGFGIRDEQTARRIAEQADAVVIGSRIVEEIEHSPAADLLANVGALVESLRRAIDAKSDHSSITEK